MKNVSSWSFDAPLAKVDIPRILEEAADACTPEGVASQGVVKVRVSSRRGESVFIVADLDLAAAASLHRGVRPPDGFITNHTRLDRDEAGGGRVNGLQSTRSPEVIMHILSGQGGLVIFAVQSDEEASQLINKLLDKVTVAVEVW